MGAVVGGAWRLGAVAGGLLLAGCAVQHEVPAADRALDIAERLTRQAVPQGPPMPVLKPVPRNVQLVIRDGVLGDYDAGGEAVLLGYMSCMDYSRGVAHGTAR